MQDYYEGVDHSDVDKTHDVTDNAEQRQDERRKSEHVPSCTSVNRKAKKNSHTVGFPRIPPRKSKPRPSPPKDIFQKPENVAELFPSDSDGVSPPDHLLSYPGSLGSSASGPDKSSPGMFYIGSDSSRPQSGVGSLSSLEACLASLEMVNDRTVENSAFLQKVKKGMSQMGLKLKSLERDRMLSLESRVRGLEESLRSMNEKEEGSSSASPTQCAAFTWTVIYDDLKRASGQPVISPLLPVPSGNKLQARLLIQGRKDGGCDDHLSLHLAKVKGPGPLTTSPTGPMPCFIQISVIDHRDLLNTKESSSVTVSVPDEFELSIPNLISIRALEDEASHFLVDGTLTLGITIREDRTEPRRR